VFADLGAFGFDPPPPRRISRFVGAWRTPQHETRRNGGCVSGSWEALPVGYLGDFATSGMTFAPGIGRGMLAAI